LARAIDQFRASDVTVWGIVALCCGGLAVLSANVSAVIPQGMLAGLHASRLEGGSLNQLRAQLANLDDETTELRRQTVALEGRLNLSERSDGEVARRVGALEISIPNLLERVPPGGIDTSAITAAIPEGESQTFDTEGGSVTVETQSMLALPATKPVEQPMPEIASVHTPKPDPDAFALAIGPLVSRETAPEVWDELNGIIGTLLIGLAPLIEGDRIVAGPIRYRSDAVALCTRMALVGIPCTPVTFTGDPL
jgi:hypothetical protein